MNLLRSLLYNDEVSLTLADTTELVGEGMRLHGLSDTSARLFGRTMSVMTYLSSCLKEDRGEVSLSVQCEGEARALGASGNSALYLRGYIENGDIREKDERLALGRAGTLTVIRDDGYNRPFVGTCAFPENADFDGILEEYYRISEQLPTRIKTVVTLDDKGSLLFAGVIALQPLPFASKEAQTWVNGLNLSEILTEMQRTSLEHVFENRFQTEGVCTRRNAIYRCNCSREYLGEVLVSLGEAQFRDVVRTEGAVRVHCHYCNKDYEFTNEDADRLFAKKI